jgi:hypothetical protein
MDSGLPPRSPSATKLRRVATVLTTQTTEGSAWLRGILRNRDMTHNAPTITRACARLRQQLVEPQTTGSQLFLVPVENGRSRSGPSVASTRPAARITS